MTAQIVTHWTREASALNHANFSADERAGATKYLLGQLWDRIADGKRRD